MKILICGIDGYIGFPLALHLIERGHEVYGIDSHARRQWVKQQGSQSVIPIPKPNERFRKVPGLDSRVYSFSLTTSPGSVQRVIEKIEPESIVHLAEQPSAPFSMIDARHATLTQNNNVTGTLNLLWAMREVAPECPMVKIGSMGEYGTPDCLIPEGVFPMNSEWIYCTGRKQFGGGELDGMLFPRKAGSFYHLSKVHDTHNVKFACDTWGLRATDIMQGVVYGTRVFAMKDDPQLATRFDVCSYFGTVLNRFCAQAVAGMPITPYGKGEQKRGFLPLRDVMQCLTLAIENPPEQGKYRTWNQFDEIYSINHLAETVSHVAKEFKLNPTIQRIENPRKEAEEHSYQVATDNLQKMGYEPSADLEGEIRLMIQDLLPHKNRILDCANVIKPTTQWAKKA